MVQPVGVVHPLRRLRPADARRRTSSDSPPGPRASWETDTTTSCRPGRIEGEVRKGSRALAVAYDFSDYSDSGTDVEGPLRLRRLRAAPDAVPLHRQDHAPPQGRVRETRDHQRRHRLHAAELPVHGRRHAGPPAPVQVQLLRGPHRRQSDAAPDGQFQEQFRSDAISTRRARCSAATGTR